MSRALPCTPSCVRACARACVLALALLLALPSGARAASPNLRWLAPPGGQRGAEVTVVLHGRRLFDAEDLLLYRPGLSVLSVEVVPKRKGRQVRVRLAIAADAPLGEHPFRLRCRSGLSELRTFAVGALPEVAEAEPNGDLAQAQAVPLDVTVTGRITAEDVDLFAFEGAKGQRVTVEVEAQRLGGAVFDAYLAVLDERRFELAVADDTPLGGTDGIASLVLPADGRYLVELREAAYRGSGRSYYRLHLGGFPRPRLALPAGGRPGETLQARLLGDPAGEQTLPFTIPPPAGAQAQDALIPWFVETAGGIAPTPVWLRRADLPGTLEVEPNGRKRATAATLPGALHGVLAKPRDRDWFRFSATKGQTFRVRAWARELGSPLDAVVNVYHAGGKHVVGNDDGGGRPDSSLRFKAPADGEYELRVRDFLDRGGPTFAYRIEAALEAPSLALTVHAFGRNSQDRQALAVPRGNRFAVLLRLERRAARGPVALELSGLPAGVAPVTTPVCPAGAAVVPVVLEAAPDAPLAGGLAAVTARHQAEPPVTGGLRHRIPLSVGPPNNAVYHAVEVDRLAVAVTEAAPFRLRLEPPPVPLVRGGVAALTVVAERAEGFAGQIEVWLLYDPPGVGSRNRVKIAKGSSRASIALNANGKAALGRWPLVAIGRASVRGALWVASAPVELEVAPARLGLSLARAAARQGSTTSLVAKVRVAAPWKGQARARLLGLPRHCSAPEVRFGAEATELRFEVTVGADAKPGKHRHVRCEVIVPQGEHGVVHRLGRTELRVDRPPPATAAAPPPPPPAKGPPPASRLEQVRAAYRRQQEAAQAEEQP